MKKHPFREFIAGELFDAIGDGISIVDLNFRILYQNKMHKSLMGNHEGEVCYKAYEKRSSVCEDCPMAQAFQDDAIHRIETTSGRENGEKSFEISASPLKNAEGRIIAGIEIIHDITKRKRTEETLRDSEARYRLLVENQNDLIIKLDNEFRIRFAAPNFCRFIGKAEKELTGRDFMSVLGMPESKRLRDTLSLVLTRKDRSTYFEEEVSTPDGQYWIGWSTKAVTDKTGSVHEIIAVGRDITDRKLIEKRFENSQQILINVLDGIDAIVYVADMKTHRILYINKYAKNILGNLVGKFCWDLFQVEQGETCNYCRRDRLLDSRGRASGVYHWEFHNTGNRRWYDVRDRAIYWYDGRIVRLEIASDITNLKESEEILRSMSFIDDLTELHNRRGFLTLAEQQLKMAHREKSGMILIFADIDNMKWINDELGHPAGDRALRDSADILRMTFRESDIIARIGGDEFVVLAMESPEINVTSISSRLMVHLDEFNVRAERPYQLSLSLGIVRYDPRHPRSLEKLMASADELMYEHKKSKK